MINEDRKREEYYEKLGAILRTLDQFDVPDGDRAALTWIAVDYFEKLGSVIGTEPKK